MLFKVSGGKKLKTKWAAKRGHDAVVSSVIFGSGPTAGIVASASWDGTVKLWAIDSPSSNPTPLATLVHDSKVTDVSFAANGSILVASTSDFQIRAWATSGDYQCLASYQVPDSEGQFTCISGGISSFVSGSESGMLRIWPLPVEGNVETYFEPAQ